MEDFVVTSSTFYVYGRFLLMLCALVLLIVSIIKYQKLGRAEKPSQVRLTEIWIVAVTALLSGLYGLIRQITNIYDFELNEVAEAGDISPTIIATGQIKVGLLTLLTGFLLCGLSILVAVLLRARRERLSREKQEFLN